MAMRRLTTTSSAGSSAASRTLEQARVIARQEVRIRELEATLALEEHRREALEAKYNKLKRHYARLERAHIALQIVSGGGEGRREGITMENGQRLGLSPSSGGNSSTESAGSPHSPPAAVAAALAGEGPRSPDRDDAGVVIDLTSPVGSRRTSLASPRWRNPEQAHPAGDVIAESPRSPNGAAAVQPLGRQTTPGSATRRSTRLANARPSPDTLPPPAPPATTAAAAAPRVSGTRRRHLDFQTADPTSRPRPRLGPNPSDDRPSPARAAATTSRHNATLNAPTDYSDDRRRRRSPAQEESKSDAEAAYTSTADSDEAASIALAQYLQRQENMAAMQEYQERVRALEFEHEQRLERERLNGGHHHQHHHRLDARPGAAAAAAVRGGGRLHDAAVDPDNMTYEELLQLGEQVGDVKKERWRQVAVQVLSRLPTHRWTTRSSDDISCIICQYGFSVGDVALTLPCAHVFHEECVSGWVRENNSCPLCKLEIADV